MPGLPPGDQPKTLGVRRGRERLVPDLHRQHLDGGVERRSDERLPGWLPHRRPHGEELAPEVQERVVHPPRAENRRGAIEGEPFCDSVEVAQAPRVEAQGAARGIVVDPFAPGEQGGPAPLGFRWPSTRSPEVVRRDEGSDGGRERTVRHLGGAERLLDQGPQRHGQDDRSSARHAGVDLLELRSGSPEGSGRLDFRDLRKGRLREGVDADRSRRKAQLEDRAHQPPGPCLPRPGSLARALGDRDRGPQEEQSRDRADPDSREFASVSQDWGKRRTSGRAVNRDLRSTTQPLGAAPAPHFARLAERRLSWRNGNAGTSSSEPTRPATS